MGPLALALLASGTAANLYGGNRVAKAGMGALNDGMHAEALLQKELGNEVLNSARQTYDPTSRNLRYEQAATDREAGLGAMLRKVDSAPEVDAHGQMSKDYLVAKAGRTAEQAGAIAKLTRLVARAGAGDKLRLDDSVAGLESADRADAIGQRMREARALMEARMGDAEHAGDNAKLLGQVLSMSSLLSGGKPSAGVAPAAAGAPNWQNTGMFIFPSR